MEKVLNSLHWDSDKDISISVSSLILNDDSCKRLGLMVLFVKQISAVSPATVCSIFLSFAISKEDWAIKLITHLWEVIYTLRLLRKGKFHSCTWSNGCT